MRKVRLLGKTESAAGRVSQIFESISEYCANECAKKVPSLLIASLLEGVATPEGREVIDSKSMSPQ